MNKSNNDWKKDLTPEQYSVLREKGTEAPFSGKYNLTKDDGVYNCAGCSAQLFSSNTKFNSGCGWPSFDQAIEGAVELVPDSSHGMQRTEVVCTNCGGHLGHIFDDGPTDTGKRYCINSISLNLKKD